MGLKRIYKGWKSSLFFPPTSPNRALLVHCERSGVLRNSPRSRGLSVACPKWQALRPLDEGHVDVWPTVQRLDQSVVDYEYDYFPRGRVNWRKEDDQWLLVLDPKLNHVLLSLTSCWRGKYLELD